MMGCLRDLNAETSELVFWLAHPYHTPIEVYDMRTNIVLDDGLVREAMRLSKARTKREAVDVALRAYVTRSKQRDILKLIDQELIAPDYDVRAIRRKMSRDTR